MSKEEVEERCHQRYVALVAEINGHIKTFEAEIRADERKQIVDAILAKLNEVGDQINGYEDVDGYGFYCDERLELYAESHGLYEALEIIEGRSGNGE